MTTNRGIIFGDFQGYSRLRAAQVVCFYRRALPRLKRNLVRRQRLEGVSSPLEVETWGDGLMQVHASATDAGRLAVILAEEVDKPAWQADLKLSSLLRIRLAVHAGHLQGDTANWMSGRDQYIGKEFVLPARIEPKVAPGEVWCTEQFRDVYAPRPGDDLVFDPLGKVELAKEEPPAPLHRLRRARRNEDQLRAIEARLKSADKAGNAKQLRTQYGKLRAHLKGRDRFAPMSHYRDWVTLADSMIKHSLYREAEDLLRAFRAYLVRHRKLGARMQIRIDCGLANCASNRGTPKALATARSYVDRSRRLAKTMADKTEVRSIIAAQQKRIALSTANPQDRLKLMREAHRTYLKAYKDGNFDYYPGINAATTAAYLAALSDNRRGRSHKDGLVRAIAGALIHRFTLRRPTDGWEAATLAEAMVLVGRGEAARKVLRRAGLDRFQQHSMCRQMQSLASFPGIAEGIRDAASLVLAAIDR